MDYVDGVPHSLDDWVETRRVFSPPLMLILGTLSCTVLCSVLNLACLANHRYLILLCLSQIDSITDCYTSSNRPSLSSVFLSLRFMSRVIDSVAPLTGRAGGSHPYLVRDLSAEEDPVY